MQDISSNTSQLYRITYEAYSKFANGINRCSNLEEIANVCRTNLKYLINFRILRMCIIREKDNFIVEQFSGNIWYDFESETEIFPYERDLKETGIPLLSGSIPEKLLKNKIERSDLFDPVLWGWAFDKTDSKVIVSLLADQHMTFSVGDIDILKLVVDCIQSKFNEIYLKKQLAIQNKNLTEAYETIKLKNEQIETIVKNQQQTINKRTESIAEKNKKLLHISALNAHNVREPLSRIQGIVQLAELVGTETFKSEMMPKLESTVNELDEVLHEVVEMATKEIVALKAEEL